MNTEQINQISKLVELYKKGVKLEELIEIERILKCGNNTVCFFDDVDAFFKHYQEWSRTNEKLDLTKIEIILDYFALNNYIVKQNKYYSKKNKFTNINLEKEEYIYNVLDLYKDTKN